MGLILPQINEVTINSNNVAHYHNLGYIIPTIINRGKEKFKLGEKIKVHALDLAKGSHVMVMVQCDECGKLYFMPYKDYLTNYCVQKIGKLFCFDCINHAMSKYGIASQKIWNDRNYALAKLDEFIKKYGTLKGWTVNNKEGALLNNRLNSYKYDLNELCEELGYNYLELKGLKYPEGYFNDYENVKSVILEFIEEHGHFPTQIELRFDLGIACSIVQKFGGSEKIKDDLNYIDNDLIDDLGFRNRSHYEYMVAQFLIHNNISFKREEHPFPEPYNNLRSDFTFEKVDGTIYHLEVWGYKESDVHGKRSQIYCKRKAEKLELYKKYNINLISIENDVFSNSFNSIQEKLKNILSDILDTNLKIVDHKYLMHPYKLTDNELFEEIMKLSEDSITLPKETDFTPDNKKLFYEALKRFGNYNKFAKHFGVVTNRKRGYWNEKTVLNRMFQIHDKYGYMPTSIEIRNNKLAKDDSLFIGIVDGIKSAFGNTIQCYLRFYENCISHNVELGDKDIEYLTNLYNLKYFRKDMITKIDRQRAYDILRT